MNADEKRYAQFEEAELLSGAIQIAQFLFGDTDKSVQRRVYHLAENHDLPAFKIGKTLYARKSKLLDWIKLQESPPHF